MIKVNLPPSSSVGYTLVKCCLIGPLDLSSGHSAGIPTLETELFDSKFIESPGLGGDNNLDQLKTEGQLAISPLYEDCSFKPATNGLDGWASGNIEFTNLYQGSVKTTLSLSSILCSGSGYDQVLSWGTSGELISKSHSFSELSGSTYDFVGCTILSRFTRLGMFDHTIVDLSDPIVSGYTVTFPCVRMYADDPAIYLDRSWFTDQKSREDVLQLMSRFHCSTTTGRLSFPLYRKEPPQKSYDVDSILKEVMRYVNDIMEIAVWPPPFDFGELAKQASDKAKAVDTNLIGFIRDLRHPTEMIPKLKNLRQLTKNKKLLKKLKNASDDYLTVKYGWLPTASDLQEILGAFKRHDFRDKNGLVTLNAGHTSSSAQGFLSLTTTRRIKIAVSDESNPLQSLYQRLYNVGAFPTFTNLWDLVPYSFVIDWFVDLGSFLETIDFRLYFATLDIKYVTMSQKDVSGLRIVPVKGSPISGNITRVHYHRWVSDQCPVPPLSLTSNMQDFDHWVESGALIVQRTH